MLCRVLQGVGWNEYMADHVSRHGVHDVGVVCQAHAQSAASMYFGCLFPCVQFARGHDLDPLCWMSARCLGSHKWSLSLLQKGRDDAGWTMWPGNGDGSWRAGGLCVMPSWHNEYRSLYITIKYLVGENDFPLETLAL